MTDGDLNILALLRNVEEGEEHEKLRVGLQYNLSLRQNYNGVPELTKERIRQGLQKAVDRQQGQPAAGKKGKKAGKDVLRKALATSITELPPLLVDHALHVASYDSTLKPEQVLADEGLLDQLLAVLQDALRITKEITEPDQVKGYILAKPNPAAPTAGAEEGESEKGRVLYEDFHPFRPAQFENSDLTFLEFDAFGKAVDEFFSSIEGQKLESKLQEREQHAKKKLEKARKEHEERIGGLQKAQELDFRKAEAILANVHRVTEATEAINGLITQGMDWVDIGRLIEREQSQGNAVAQLIKLPLKLNENTITLLLDENTWTEGQDEEDEGNDTSSVSEDTDDEGDNDKKKPAPVKVAAQPKLSIDIDLALSAWANSTEYFDSKKTAASKEERTLQASERALKSHEKKVAEDLKKGLKQEKEVLRPIRKQQWFEKYIYFISSDGYMVLGGKDAQQNEIIYQRYLRKGDVYVHSDLKGSIPMIIKNNPNTPDAPIPPSTLSQAGNLSVCTSEAWDSKAIMSAWWVLADGVTKTGQTGEFLPPGVFNIKGKKEHLPPAQLIVGLGVMFEISEDSKARHHKHRVQGGLIPKTAEEEAELAREKKTAEADEGAGSDDDDAFPDAKMASDSEEDFPDAKMDDSDESDAESEADAPSNPLQSKTADQKADSEDEEDGVPSPQKEPVATTSDNETAQTQKDEQTHGKSGIRHLSARERRLLRKGQLPESIPGSAAAEEEDEGHSAGDESKPPTRAPGTVTSQATKNSSAPLPRGKRGKAKKLATKYAAQDEEDRALAMRLLGSKSGQVAAETAANDARKKEEEALANKQRRREQHQRAQDKGKAAEEARRAALENDEGEDDETLKSNLLNLDAFTGRPLPGDTILSAIPVAAPWAALASYKYKAKIQPGSTKRGKAVKEVLSIWDNAGKDAKIMDQHSQDVERIWPREIELIRGWKEPEVVSVLPVAKVRVMISGGRRGAAAARGKKSARGGRGSKKK